MAEDRKGLEVALQADIASMHASTQDGDSMPNLHQRAFESVRRGLDFPSRITKAEECKFEVSLTCVAQSACAHPPNLCFYVLGKRKLRGGGVALCARRLLRWDLVSPAW